MFTSELYSIKSIFDSNDALIIVGAIVYCWAVIVYHKKQFQRGWKDGSGTGDRKKENTRTPNGFSKKSAAGRIVPDVSSAETSAIASTPATITSDAPSTTDNSGVHPDSERKPMDEPNSGKRLVHPEVFAAILTNDESMYEIFRYIEVIAKTEFPVLIYGETGTGKELMAQALHAASKRNGQFICANVAGIDDPVFSDTLFGHVRGAFTGADQVRKGLIDEAADGTLFLDEIGDLRPASQTKLLRLLQDNTYRQVGSDATSISKARMLFATNKDLKRMTKTGEFRLDLYYRLHAHEICIPPLRDRLHDISILAERFIGDASRQFGKPIPGVKPELYTLLSSYHWPGNVRELQGLLAEAVSRNETSTLSLVYLKKKLQQLRDATRNNDGEFSGPFAVGNSTGKIVFPPRLPKASEWEMFLLREALKRTNGNKSQAAELLGISRATIINRLKGIDQLTDEIGSASSV